MLALPTHSQPAAQPVEQALPFGIATWPDEAAFIAADPRRRTASEVDLGATWRRPGSDDAWKLAWLAETGELFLCRLAGYPASCTDVTVLAVISSERDLDATLDGWREHRSDEDGLTWLAARLTPVPRCA